MSVLFLCLTAGMAPFTRDIAVEAFPTWPAPFFLSYHMYKWGGEMTTFFPLRYALTNASNRTRHPTVRLSAPTGVAKALLTRKVTVPPRSRISFTMLVPRKALHDPYSTSSRGAFTATLQVFEDEKEVARDVSTAHFFGKGRSPGSVPLVMITEQAGTSPSDLGGLRAPGSKVQVPFPHHLLTLPAASVPAHLWQAYWGLPFVAVDETAAGRLSSTQRRALWQYAACGGTLLLVSVQPPEILPGIKLQDLRACAERPLASGTAYRFGAGLVVVSRNLPPGPEGLRKALLENPQEMNEFYLASRSLYLSVQRRLISDRNPYRRYDRRDPLTEPLSKLPARLYFVLLILCAVVVGPVNVFFVRRWKKPMLFLVTAPSLSFLFVAVLLVTSVLHFGVTVKHTVTTATVLDQHLGLATTFTAEGFVSALPPSEVTVSSETLFLPRRFPSSGFGITCGTSTTYRGVLPPLAPQVIVTAEVKRTRLRLVIEGKGRGLQATNGLGVSIQRLFVLRGGELFAAEGIRAGEKKPLRGVSTRRRVRELSELLWSRYRYVEPSAQPIARASFLPAFSKPFTDNTFVAFVQRSPFWKPAVSVNTKHSFHVVLGKLDHAP